MKTISNQIQHSEQPEALLQLRQKTQYLRRRQQTMKKENKQLSRCLTSLSDEISILNRQKQLQDRKSKSLILLVTELQRQYDESYLEKKQLSSHDNELEINLQKESKLLRKLLIKSTEKIKQNQKLLSFMRQVELNKNKAQQFIKRSNYIQNQTDLVVKLRFQIKIFENDNFECKRKWKDLELETARLENQQTLLKIQLERIKTQLKEKYEEYLEKVNEAKTKIVHFNQSQKEKIITEYFVSEMAFLQEKRYQVEENSKSLNYHHENLLEQSNRIEIENRQLKSFFGGETLNEETKLASRMKSRIDELTDTLIQYQKIATLAQPTMTDCLQYLRKQRKSIKESSDYIEMKIKDQEAGKIILNQNQIVQFFENVLKGKDQKIMINKQRQYGLTSNLKQLQIKKKLLENQLNNLEEGLKYHDFQQNYHSKNNTVNFHVDQVEKPSLNSILGHFSRNYS